MRCKDERGDKGLSIKYLAEGDIFKIAGKETEYVFLCRGKTRALVLKITENGYAGCQYLDIIYYVHLTGKAEIVLKGMVK